MIEFIADAIRDAAEWFWHLSLKQKFYLFIILSSIAATARVAVYMFWG